MKNTIAIRDRKINGKQYAYLLDVVLTGEQFDGLDDAGKVSAFFQQFNEEFNCAYNKRCYPNVSDRVGHWLQGLPTGINIDYWHDEIVKQLEAFGVNVPRLKSGELSARGWQIVNNWFNVCGYRFIQLAGLLKIDISYIY